ncbi:HNH endonuclease [Microbacterium azadirachtae]|uniref:HNH endonuclease n=1 Tax=Microbacterium azadirachtae TaxID=582680 RepID=UPI00126A0A46|nr:HNH endonuclease [Microbacterium azadirachtae]
MANRKAAREAMRRRRATLAGREANREANREASRRRRATPAGREAHLAAHRATYARLRARTEAEADADFLRLRGQTRPCAGCGELLPADAFSRDWTALDGRQRRCARNGCRKRHRKLKRDKKLAAHWTAQGIDPKVCIYCLTNPAEDLEHVMPKALGGSDDFSNLAPSCSTCNRGPGGKHDVHPITWLAITYPHRVDHIIELFPHIKETA